MRERETTRKNRWSGKKYLNCPVHGRLGTDGKLHDYIEQHAEFFDKPLDPAPKKPKEKPAAPKKRGGFGFFLEDE